MKFWLTVKKWLCDGCVYFTAIAMFFIFLNLTVNSSQGPGSINTLSFLWMFPCGLAFSFAGLLLNSKLPRWCRLLLHFAICVLAVFLFIFLPANSAARASTVMILLVLLCVLYWVLFGLFALIRSRVRKLMEED